MSRVYKKILSLFGFAFVVAITAIAYGMPSAREDAAAQSSDVIVSVTVASAGEVAISSPANGTVFYDGNSYAATVEFTDTAILSVKLVAPDGSITEIYSLSDPMGQTGSVSIPLDKDNHLPLYGNYTIEIDGYTPGGTHLSNDDTHFQFHAITATPDPDAEDSIRVFFGPAVCALNLQVFPEGITSGTPLIDYPVENLSSLPGYPNYVDIKIPGFNELDGNQKYEIIVTAFDCSGNSLEDAGIVLSGVMGPPDTGVFTIFSSNLSRANFLMSLLVVVFAATITLLWVRRDKKSTRRRH